MRFVNREIKAWILVSLIALFLWILYWIPSSISRYFGLEGIPWSVFLESGGSISFMIMELSGATGTIIRLIGVLFGIYALANLMIYKGKNFFDIKKLVVIALLFEALYFILLIPSGIVLFDYSVSLAIAYLLQVILTFPILAILAIKVYNTSASTRFNSWSLAGIAFSGYVGALWANSVFRWFDIVVTEGPSFFSIGLRTLGALNAFLIMTLALLFGAVSAYYLKKRNIVAIKWIGLTLLLVGLHFLVYFVYSYFGGMLNFVMVVEIWTIPLIGLGLALFRRNNQTE